MSRSLLKLGNSSVFTPRRRPFLNIETGHFAVLHDIHAKCVRPVPIAPHDCVVPRYAGAALHEGSKQRIPGMQTDGRDEPLDLLRRQHAAVLVG
jgi:hypothetical protein